MHKIYDAVKILDEIHTDLVATSRMYIFYEQNIKEYDNDFAVPECNTSKKTGCGCNVM